MTAPRLLKIKDGACHLLAQWRHKVERDLLHVSLFKRRLARGAVKVVLKVLVCAAQEKAKSKSGKQ